MFDQARAILWAQWRSMRNYYSRGNRGSLIFFSVVGVLWYGAVVVGSAAAAYLMSRLEQVEHIERTVATGLLLALLYWQVVPLMLAATGASVDLKRVIVYPIAVRQLFTVEVLLRLTTGIEVLILLAGGALGLLLNAHTPAWGPLIFLPFIALNLFLSAGLRDLLGRLFARKRVREISVLALVLLAAIPGLILQTDAFGGLRDTLLAAQVYQPYTPWWAAGQFASGQHSLSAAAVVLVWMTLTLLFGRWQFQRGLRFDADAARATSGKQRAGWRWRETLYRLPSMLLPDPLGMLVEKEIRFLSRAPRFRLVFIMGFTFGLVIWLPLAFQGNLQAGLGFASNYLTFVTVYALLLLGEACFWNSFGFDRAASQIYYLAPVRFSIVIVAKNIAAVTFVFLEVVAIVAVCLLVGMPVTAEKALEALGVTLVLTVFLLAAGNIASIYNPRAVNPTQSWRSSASKFQALLMLIYPLMAVPIGLAYLARYAFDSDLAFYGVLLFDLALAGVTYWVAMDTAVNAADRNREQIVAALSRGESPVST
jgi:ABC-2 type transport system permease protein